MHKYSKVCLLGLGYIGLPTAVLLANRGYEVLGVDINPDVVDSVNQGKLHIVEPGLDAFLRSAVNSGNLKASLTPSEADVFIIAVPTPTKDDHSPVTDYVFDAAKSIIPFLKKDNLVINESTSPIGTTEGIEKLLSDSGVNTEELFIAYCPERVLPGKIMLELVENDRIIGGTRPDSSEVAAAFYKTFIEGEAFKSDSKTAEMAKLSENSYRDVNIAFANELSLLCNTFGINPWELIKLANRHPRVNILTPGCGVGGHCIAVDPWFLVHSDPENSVLIRTARERNDYKSAWVAQSIMTEAEKFKADNGKEAKIACMGLAFKPNIDDLRESPALEITEMVIDKGYEVIPVEPNIEKFRGEPLVGYETAVKEADIIVLLVNHKEFSDIDTSGKKVLNFCGVNQI